MLDLVDTNWNGTFQVHRQDTLATTAEYLKVPSLYQW